MLITKVPVFYLPQLMQVLQTLGVDSEAWLRQAGVEAGQIMHEGSYLAVNQYLELLNSAVALSNKPEIGLMVGAKLSIGSHGLLGYSLLNCRDLSHALEVLQRYLQTRSPIIKAEVSQSDDRVQLVFDVPQYIGLVYRSFVESAFLSVYNLVMFLTQGSAKFTQLQLDFAAPGYAKVYLEYFDCPIEFGAQRCCLTLDAGSLHQHFANDDPIALAAARKRFEQQLQALQDLCWEHNVSEKIYQLLYQERHLFPDLETIAGKLCITSRTLHRRLTAEGTSYREILHAVKAKLAKQYLSDSLYTVAQISDLLGYDNVANFRRAFKQWEGLTPQQYKQQSHTQFSKELP